MSLEGERLRVSSPMEPHLPPVQRMTLPGQEGGYGLNIVDTLSDTWGYDVDGTLKAVWASLDLNLAQAW